MCMLVAQLCLTLCNPMGHSPPGSLFGGIFQARIVNWVAIPFSRRSSQLHCSQILYHLSHHISDFLKISTPLCNFLNYLQQSKYSNMLLPDNVCLIIRQMMLLMFSDTV